MMLENTSATRSPPFTKVAIIGAGFGGIAMAIRLQQQGIHDFILLEKGNEFGGTWRDNFPVICAEKQLVKTLCRSTRDIFLYSGSGDRL